jgi:hypothetical protein
MKQFQYILGEKAKLPKDRSGDMTKVLRIFVLRPV